MAAERLRDRDSIITEEGLIFRVFGYTHPSEAYICDVEYGPASVFKSNNPRAFRDRGKEAYYKFYEDEGWKFIQSNFPQYMLLHEMLRRKVIGVRRNAVSEVKKPEKELEKLFQAESKDSLLAAMRNILEIADEQCGLPSETFGVFGSLLHGFYHPMFSDVDFTVYGRANVAKLCESLQELYEANSALSNEFETDESIKGKVWRFQNLTPQEFLQHQRRKLIYSLFDSKAGGRRIKTEFEPVRDWREIGNEYDPETGIVQRGWVKMLAIVRGDDDAPFMPSAYDIEPLRIVEGEREAQQAKRIVSYVEEFRMQAFRDEVIYVEGNLEEVTSDNDDYFQVALSYCPRYYEQVLKAVGM